jgi:hypothetical protein
MPNPAPTCPLGSAGRQVAVHVGRAAAHHGAGEHVLGDRRLQEPDRSDDLDLPGLDVGLVDHPADPAVVIDVAVGMHDRDDRLARPVGVVQLQRGCRGVPGQQRIEHDDPVLALGEGDVGQVRGADLVQARHDFIQAALDHQLGLAPQARVDRRRRVGALLDEREPRQIPTPDHRPRRGSSHHRSAARSDHGRPRRSRGGPRRAADPAAHRSPPGSPRSHPAADHRNSGSCHPRCRRHHSVSFSQNRSCASGDHKPQRALVVSSSAATPDSRNHEQTDASAAHSSTAELPLSTEPSCPVHTRIAGRSQAVAAPRERVSGFADELGEVRRCRGVTIWPRV